MKKLFFALFALAMLTACSDDDDNQGTRKLMTTAIIDGDALVFQYDDAKNLEAIHGDGEAIYTFNYDSDNNLIAISDEDDTDTPFITIQYQNGQIASITNSGATLPVTYNQQTKKYEIGGVNIEAGLVGRDLGTVDEIGGDNLLSIDYFSEKRGPFYDVPTKNTFLYGLLLDLYYFTPTMPIQAVTENGATLTAENTYDDEGNVVKMTMKSGTEIQGEIVFQYSEL
jgi:hypothetical protein